jgi:hypothetical protein
MGPALVMAVCALISFGLNKIYGKFCVKNEPQVVVLTPEELIKKLKEQEENFIKKEQEENKDDSV